MKLYFEAYKKQLNDIGELVEMLDKQIEVTSKTEAISLKTIHTGYDSYRFHTCRNDEQLPCSVEVI